MKNIKKVLTVALAICFAGGNILTAPVWTFAAEHDVRTEIKDNIETVQEAEESPTLQDPENLKSEEVASITEDQALDRTLRQKTAGDIPMDSLSACQVHMQTIRMPGKR